MQRTIFAVLAFCLALPVLAQAPAATRPACPWCCAATAVCGGAALSRGYFFSGAGLGLDVVDAFSVVDGT